MHSYSKLGLVCAAAAIFALTAWTQERTLPEGTTIKLLLLRQKSVQKELEIPADVSEKIHDFTHAQAEAAWKAKDLEDGKRTKAFEMLENQNKKFVAKILSEKQLKRLNQITMQFTSLHQLTKAEAVTKLKLTEAQQEKLKELHVKSHKDLKEIFAAKDAEGRSDKFAKHRKEIRASILAILTDEQKAQVREMVGEPFLGDIIFEEYKEKK